MTIDSSYNTLVTQSFAPEFGYHNTFLLPSSPHSRTNQKKLPSSVKAHLLFDEDAAFTDLNRKINTIYTLKVFEINKESNVTKEALRENTTALFIKRKNGDIDFITLRTKLSLDEGDQLVVLTPGDESIY